MKLNDYTNMSLNLTITPTQYNINDKTQTVTPPGSISCLIGC